MTTLVSVELMMDIPLCSSPQSFGFPALVLRFFFCIPWSIRSQGYNLPLQKRMFSIKTLMPQVYASTRSSVSTTYTLESGRYLDVLHEFWQRNSTVSPQSDLFFVCCGLVQSSVIEIQCYRESWHYLE